MQEKIDTHGRNMTDTAPLNNIKKAISGVKDDLKGLDLRIGVVSNMLLQAKLKERSKMETSKSGLDIISNEYDLDIDE